MAVASLFALGGAAVFLPAEVVRLRDARLIEQIRAPSSPSPALSELTEAIARRENLIPALPCPKTLLVETVDLMAKKADLQVSAGDFAPGMQDIQSAEALALKLIACAPAGGIHWLRLGELRAQMDGGTPETLDLFRISHRLSPRELWQAVDRLRWARKLDDVLRQEDKEWISGDIAAVEGASPETQARALKILRFDDVPALRASLDRVLR